MDRLKVIKRNTEDNKITVVISDNGKKIKRRLMPVASNFFKIKYNKKQYYIVFYSISDATDSLIFELDPKVPESIYWNNIPELYDEIIQEFKYLESADKSVPSGPDTSKFTSVKKGNLRWEYQYWTSRFYSRVGYKYMFMIGTGIPLNEDRKRLINTLMTVFLNAAKTGLTLNDKPVRLGEVSGTAWTGYGFH